jgi:SAM-dependent methyltransferase
MLLSHQVETESLELAIEKIKKRIIKEGDKPHATSAFQLQILEELTQFELGRFVLLHGGLNGYWTHYILTHPWKNRKTGLDPQGLPFKNMEHFFLNRAPAILATQQRFEIFLKQNQMKVKDGAKLACIPSGLLGELLYLDFSGIQEISLIGIDLDPETLTQAEMLAEQQGLSKWMKTLKKDAWDLRIENEFDLISSNGLNIYEPNDAKVTQLYQQFYRALVPGGRLVTSFLSFPPLAPDQCEWELSKIDKEAALLQRIIFSDLLGAKWQCYRSSHMTEQQLKAAGFKEIEFIYDEAKIFPTVIAEK